MNQLGSVLHDVLRAKYKGCEYSTGETYESLHWLDKNTPKPSLEQLETDIKDYEANREKYDYRILREQLYPSINEKIEALWQSMCRNNPTLMKDLQAKIEAIDAKYPGA